MSTNSQTLDAIFNEGERLVPGETHGRDEVVRHKSSYQLFRDIIESDILRDPSMIASGFTILDIGCGTGHGTFMLSEILGAQITGIDPSIESVQYAKDNYGAKNIQYVNSDAESFVRESHSFDYVVSRHALEHVVDGLNFALNVDCRNRLMINVPFNEADGNVHHLVHWIKEEHFNAYPNKEYFYEGLDGITELTRTEENPPNSILCVSSADRLVKVGDMLAFPRSAWRPEFLQQLGLSVLADNLPEREVLIVEREEQIRVHEALIVEREEQIRVREALIVEREEQIRVHEALIVEREEQIRVREALIVEREEQIRGREALIIERDEQIRGRELQAEVNLASYEQLLLVRLVRKVKRIFK